jgi:hypothetical protein
MEEDVRRHLRCRARRQERRRRHHLCRPASAAPLCADGAASSRRGTPAGPGSAPVGALELASFLDDGFVHAACDSNARIARDNALAAVFPSTGVAAMAGGAALYLWPPTRAANVSVTPAGGGGYVTAVGRF